MINSPNGYLRLFLFVAILFASSLTHAEYRIGVVTLDKQLKPLVSSLSNAGPTPIYEVRPSDFTAKNFFRSTLIYSIVVYSTATGAIIPNATLTVTVPKGRANSGGHDHDDSNRPAGTLTYLTGNTGPTGFDFAPTFTAPEVAGVVDILGNCSIPSGGVCIQDTPLPIAIRHPDLVTFVPGSDYELIGSFGQPGVASKHTSNHFGTVSLINKLRLLASIYFMGYSNQSNPKLLFNDISLQEGGMFDVANNWQSVPLGHAEHRIGISADIGLVPAARRKNLKQMLIQAGIVGILYEEKNHWHIREFGSAQ